MAWTNHAIRWHRPRCRPVRTEAPSRKLGLPLWTRRQIFTPSNTIAAILAASHNSPLQGEKADLTVNGFVRSVRNQKRMSFAVIGDGSTIEPLQAVLTSSQAEGLSTGTGVQITGEWRPSPPGKQQSHELHATAVKILGQADSGTYPLQKKYHSPEFLRTFPHLRTRTPLNSLLLRLRSHAIARLTTFFSNRDIYQTHPPIITSSDCEGAGEAFSVTTSLSQTLSSGSPRSRQDPSELFFRSPKYLTVSSQLHLEALAQSVGQVWTLSPTFRAEKSDTPRHLSEFYMLEAELCFIDRLGGIMSLVEDMLQDLAKSLQNSTIGHEILMAKRNWETGEEDGPSISAETLRKRWQGIEEGPWPRITYSNAIELLKDAVHDKRVAFEYSPSWDDGLHAEHERFIAEDVGHGKPVFVTDYPQKIKAFYMAPSESESTNQGGPAAHDPTVACFDLLMPEICEVAGGSMREHRLPQLLTSMRAHGLVKKNEPSEAGDPDGNAVGQMPMEEEDLGNLQWYADLRKWGSVPHGGFGLGFDRLLGYLAGVRNIRDVVTFPRVYGRCDC
ncbi:MAG: Asparaginyl-tRNA synthetase [Pycnora praestabilis]|nr:MAG: Asparaginyl-tRNA synthetase [Pycnora praestabilis]